MKKHFQRLAALISVSLAQNAGAVGVPTEEVAPPPDDNTVELSPLNVSVSQFLAGHRSHSSHGSHRSHRSSSGGGYSVPSYPAPEKSTPPPPAAPSQRPSLQSDPLGQKPRPESSYPTKKSPQKLLEALQNKEKRKNIIMRMQLTLQLEGYYDGAIDGIMGPKTRKATLLYKRAHGLSGDKVLDAETLDAFGIKGF